MVEKIIPWWRKAIDYAMNGIRSLLGGGRAGNDKAGGGQAHEAAREEEPEIELSVKQIFPPIEALADELVERFSAPEVEAAPEDVGQVDEVAAPVVEQVAQPDVEEEIVDIEAQEEDSTGTEGRIEAVDAMAKPAPETMAEVEAILEALNEAQTETVAAQAVLAVAAAEVESEAASEVEMVELAAEKTKLEEIAVEAEATPAAEEEEAPEVEAALHMEPVEADLETAIAQAVEEQQAVEPEPVVAAVAEAETEPEAEAEPAPAAAEPEPTLEEAPKVEMPQTVPVKTEAEQKTAARVAAAVKAREESADPSPFSIFVGQVYDGPLDLLLDLIRKQDIDIYDIPIARITAQFLAYVNQLKASDMDVAGEFIYTASLLIHIKSKMLLPRTGLGPDDAAEDPRRELVDRLLEHERFKNAAQMLQQKQMLEAATWTNPGVREFREDAGAEPEIAADTTDLVRVFQEILERARNRPIINVEEDSVTVGQMIQFLARRLTMEDKPVALHKLLSHTRSERALIAMFLALLEMVRLQAILLKQDRHFSEIFIKKHSGFEAAMDQGLASARDDWR